VQLLDSKLPDADQLGGLLLEPCERGTVLQWMQHTALTDSQIIRIAKEVVSALQHLASHDILHRDLQPCNLWLTGAGGCKLANFGSSITKTEWNSMTQTQRNNDLQAFTQAHLRAPEQFDHRPQVGSGVDMWGLGCLLYGLLFFENAFAADDLEDQLSGHFKTQKKPVSGMWLDLLTRLFEVSPAKRPSASEVLSILESSEVPGPVESSSDQGHNDPTNSWVKAVLISTDSPIDPEAFQKILADSWSNPSKVPEFFSHLVKEDVDRTIVGLKALLLLHRYLTHAPPQALYLDPGALRFLASVDQAWSTKTNKDLLYSDYVAGLMRYYGNLLREKLRLHRYSELDGDWTGGGEVSRPIVDELNEFMGRCLNFTGHLLKISTDLPILRVQVAAEVYSEVLSLAGVLSRSLRLLLKQSQMDVEGLCRDFQANCHSTKVLLEKLRAHDPSLSLAELPAEPTSQPEQLSDSSATVEFCYETAVMSECQGMGSESSMSSALLTLSSFASSKVPGTNRLETGDFLFTMTNPAPEASAEGQSAASTESLSNHSQSFLSHLDTRWLIPAQDIQIKDPLGTGSSSTVYRGIYKRTEVAVKVMRALIVPSSSNKEFEREVSAMVQLRHPNIVLFMGLSVDRDMAIISEFCSGGSLFKLLHQRKDVEVTWSQRLKILKDVARGMLYLHEMSPPLIHRDLKSLNILLQEPVRGPHDPIIAKVTDFGITRDLDETANMTGQMGTCHWMAPEVLMSQPYSLAADVFSYGVLAWEVASRRTPYKHLKPISIPFFVAMKGQRPNLAQVEQRCPEALISLIQESWGHEASSRPTFSDILDRLELMQV
jgi:serine/threonine protein kinase